MGVDLKWSDIYIYIYNMIYILYIYIYIYHIYIYHTYIYICILYIMWIWCNLQQNHVTCRHLHCKMTGNDVPGRMARSQWSALWRWSRCYPRLPCPRATAHSDPLGCRRGKNKRGTLDKTAITKISKIIQKMRKSSGKWFKVKQKTLKRLAFFSFRQVAWSPSECRGPRTSPSTYLDRNSHSGSAVGG